MRTTSKVVLVRAHLERDGNHVVFLVVGHCWDRTGKKQMHFPMKTASDLVGRPGLDPGTLGLKVLCSSG
jgi:hypothetical protein